MAGRNRYRLRQILVRRFDLARSRLACSTEGHGGQRVEGGTGAYWRTHAHEEAGYHAASISRVSAARERSWGVFSGECAVEGRHAGSRLDLSARPLDGAPSSPPALLEIEASRIVGRSRGPDANACPRSGGRAVGLSERAATRGMRTGGRLATRERGREGGGSCSTTTSSSESSIIVESSSSRSRLM